MPAELRKGLLAHLDGDAATAEAAYRQAMADPALLKAARHHLIRLLDAEMRWAETLELHHQACEVEPHDAEAHQALAMSLLAGGQYAEGWAVFEARKALPAVRRYLPRVGYPEWDGRPVRTLTVWDEQGIGDSIQFARFLPRIAAQGVEVTFVCRPALMALMACLGVRLVSADQPEAIPQAEAWVMLDSLPGRLGITPETAGSGAYLRAPEARRALWARQIGPGTRIGVVTSGNRNHPNDIHRSLPAEAAAFLLSLPASLALEPGFSPLPLADLADTAAVIERLSLVITVDTAVAHLAGAMGKPCWILLPHLGTDWRWMRGRSDSPWYPSATLYRQSATGGWGPVLRQVAADLPRFFGQA